MIDVINPDEDYSVGDFEKTVNNILNENGEKNEEYNVLVSITHDIKNAIAMVLIEKRR